MPKPRTKGKKTIKKNTWCVMHWLTGKTDRFGTEKDCKKWARKMSFNPQAPIFYAFPVAGIVIHYHEVKPPLKVLPKKRNKD